VVAADFTTTELNAIARADRAWNAGFGDLVRGADWDFIRGPDISNPIEADYSVRKLVEAQLAPIGCGTAVACTLQEFAAWPSCESIGGLIIFNSNRTWVNKVASNLDPNERSMNAVGMHEFGHLLGLGHVGDLSSGQVFQSAMNSSTPNADFGGKNRLHEDEADALRDNYPHSSTGRNLMLGAFEGVDGSDNGVDGDITNSREVWTDLDLDLIDGLADDEAVVCPGQEYAGADRPGRLLVNYVGTGTSNNVKVRYYLREAGSTDECGSSSDSTPFETVTFSQLAMDNPSTAQPFDWSIPAGMPAGSYVPCAVIDPFDDVAETSENDNIVVGDGTLQVLETTDVRCF
jgi:hypothetical protein